MGTAIGELLEKKEISLEFLNGRTLGFDSHNIIYQFLSSIRGPDGTPLMDSEGNVTSHLTGLLYRTVNLMERGIKPVFVFDGKPHKLKKETLEERKKIRTEAIEKHETALKEGNLDEAKKYGSRALKLTDDMVSDAKKLLRDMGLPVVEAPSEGEAQAACMVSKGDLYGAVSQDYDTLLFGTPLFFRNITVSGRRKIPGKNIYIEQHPEMIELEKTLSSLSLTRQKLIWLSILIGTDFNEKFPKIGPKTALQLVRKHDSFEKIISETSHTPNFDYKEIEEIFLKPEHTEEYSLKFSPPNKEAIKEFLCEKHDFSEERVENALTKLEQKSTEKGQQSRLDSWT